MEKMWSPWRSEYIESFSDKNPAGDECIFCKALLNSEDEKSLIVAVFENSFVILNKYPYNNGHIMVVPKMHISDFAMIDPEIYGELFSNINLSIKCLKELLKPDGFNIGANIGKSSGAGVEGHLHFHIVPRWNGDTNFMPVCGDVKVISQDLFKTKTAFSEFFKQYTKTK